MTDGYKLYISKLQMAYRASPAPTLPTDKAIRSHANPHPGHMPATFSPCSSQEVAVTHSTTTRIEHPLPAPSTLDVG